VKTHYARQGSASVTACGVYRDAPKTHHKRSVSCLRCRGTHVWKSDAYKEMK